MSGRYSIELETDPNVSIHVRFTTRRRDVTNYAVLLTIVHEGKIRSVRLYDGVHGINEMHRYTRDQRKQLAEVFHHGTLGEGMREAIEQVKRTYESMIEGWQER